MPFKKIKRAVKKITKPIAKVLDKVVPNEVKPFLPFAAAAAPLFFTGGLGGTTLAQQMLRRGALFGGLNLGAQLAQEGSEGDFSGISTLLAAGSGALTAPGGLVTVPGADAGLTQTITQTPAEFFKTAAVGETGLKKFGLQALEKTAGGLQSAGETVRDPFSATLKDVGKAAFTPLTQGTTDLAMATARKALKDYDQALLDYEAETGAAQTASDTARRTAVIEAMTAGQHSDDVINETLTLLGLDTLLAKDGGVVKMKDGGIMDLGGKEMDLRGGGFVPIGKKERADDVPARLSKNEFVMTADAVRGAGGGNINEGARRMYETMNKLEARA
jgi:hypothetical protein